MLTRPRPLRDWHARSNAVTVTTIHPQYGPIRRGVLRLSGGVWHIQDGEGFDLGTHRGDYLDAEAALFAATAVLDALDDVEPGPVAPDLLRTEGQRMVAEGAFQATQPQAPDYDPNPTLVLGPGRAADRFFAEYGTDLADWKPSWHRDDLGRLASELARLARERRDRAPGS